jgi:hypothetical protein
MKNRKIFTLGLALSCCLVPLATNAYAASKDACSLFTSADAQAALSEPVGAPRSENRSSGVGDGSSCQYRSTIGNALRGKSVSVEVHYSQTDLTGSASGIKQNLNSAGFKTVHDVTGIGRAAIWATNSILGRAQGELTVIQGKSVMLIVIINGFPDESNALARAKTIASKAIGKL